MRIRALSFRTLPLVLFCAVASLVALGSKTVQALPVLPGIEGFGIDTVAGRGGKIIRVTTLADSGDGSLRSALETPGPRVVLFEVGGTIELSKDLSIRDPFVTVAGQTAPQPGITLKGAGLRIKTHDVLIAHLRVRVGDEPGGTEYENRDGIALSGRSDGSLAVENIVIDHCSISWAIDEGVATWYPGVRNVTINASIISENLDASLHPKGAHSSGLLIGDYSERITVSRNLFAHNAQRSPLMKGNTTTEVVNNIIYNAQYPNSHFADDKALSPIVATIKGNLYIAGPDTNTWLLPIHVKSNVTDTGGIFLEDNGWLDNKWRANAWLATLSDQWQLVKNDSTSTARAEAAGVSAYASNAMPLDQVLDFVLNNAGARPAERDTVDARVVAEVQAGEGGIIDSQNEVGGWPDLPSTTRSLELPANPQADDDGDGYTNLEEWLHVLSARVEGRDEPPGEPLEILTESLPDATVGTPYEHDLTSSGQSVSWRITSGGLPEGVNLDATGRLYGLPVAAGIASFEVQATENDMSVRAVLDLTVHPEVPAPSITTQTLPDAIVFEAYAFALSATGGVAPLEWRLAEGSASLPEGFAISPDGRILGKAQSVQTASFAVKVTDARGMSAQRSLTLTISASPVQPLEILTSSLPNARVGASYWVKLEARGGNAPLSWQITKGRLPRGITLDDETGALFGFVHAKARTKAFTLNVTDATGSEVRRRFEIQVDRTQTTSLRATRVRSAFDI